MGRVCRFWSVLGQSVHSAVTDCAMEQQEPGCLLLARRLLSLSRPVPFSPSGDSQPLTETMVLAGVAVPRIPFHVLVWRLSSQEAWSPICGHMEVAHPPSSQCLKNGFWVKHAVLQRQFVVRVE